MEMRTSSAYSRCGSKCEVVKFQQISFVGCWQLIKRQCFMKNRSTRWYFYVECLREVNKKKFYQETTSIWVTLKSACVFKTTQILGIVHGKHRFHGLRVDWENFTRLVWWNVRASDCYALQVSPLHVNSSFKSRKYPKKIILSHLRADICLRASNFITSIRFIGEQVFGRFYLSSS